MSLTEFSKYLESNKNVSNHKISFYVQWARKFIIFCRDQPGLVVPNKLLDPFLRQLGKQHKQWQVDQAMESVNLYCYFLNMVSSEPTNTERISLDDWKTAGDLMVKRLRLKQLSYRTEQTYMRWLRAFYVLVKPTSPNDLADHHIINYLSYLAADRHVAKATQDQAFNALLFFYRNVLEKQVGSIGNAVRSKHKQRLPTVLTYEEVMCLIDHLHPRHQLMGKVIYGGGLRRDECIRLRVKDLDFFSRPAMTFARSSNCWGMPSWKPP